MVMVQRRSQIMMQGNVLLIVPCKSTQYLNTACSNVEGDIDANMGESFLCSVTTSPTSQEHKSILRRSFFGWLKEQIRSDVVMLIDLMLELCVLTLETYVTRNAITAICVIHISQLEGIDIHQVGSVINSIVKRKDSDFEQG
ncbi:hypothetical protein VNO77_41186 [Canavalia gladiata]|uniref:Uncharacterized protein n=1 Tax=Canavalia gladiata TaxID=3824 RepID=A0AAN9PQ06_CANGL